MKWLLASISLLFTGLAISWITPDEPVKGTVKAIIYDKDGNNIWDNEDNPITVSIEEGIPQIQLGKELPIFEEYLQASSASTMGIWIDIGNGFQHYGDFKVDQLKSKYLDPEPLAPLTTSWPKPNSHHEEGDEDLGEEATYGIEHVIWRQKQKGGFFDWEAKNEARKYIEKSVAEQKEKNKIALRDAGIAQWSNMGPDNIGGRVRTIAINPVEPKVMYVGAVGGGIWKTEDGGDKWILTDNFMASLAVTSIVINPQDPDILYAATGEGHTANYVTTSEGDYSAIGIPGAGVFKSTDAGETWVQLPNFPVTNWVNKLAIHPTNPNIVFAAAISGPGSQPSYSGGRLYKTTNGGNTWLAEISFSAPLLDVDISPAAPDLVTASGREIFWRSTDGGNNFSMVSIGAGNRRIEIDMVPDDEDIMYALVGRDSTSTNGNRCEIYESTNAGVTWSLVFSDVNNVYRSDGIAKWATVLWVDPKTKALYFGGVDLWTVKLGNPAVRLSNWRYYHKQTVPDSFSLHADQHAIVPHPDYDASTNKTVFFGNDGGIQKTDDLENVSIWNGWVNLNSKSMGITQFYSGAVSRDGLLFGGGSQDNSFSVGTDVDNWYQPVTGDGAYMAINWRNKDTIYANVNYNKLWRSSDGGSNWERASYFPEPSIPLRINVDLESDDPYLISPLSMDPDNPSLIFLGGSRLFRYHGANETMDTIKAALSNARITSIDSENNGQRILVGYDNGVVHLSNNGGNSWGVNIAPIGTSGRFVTDIDINRGNTHALVSFGGYNNIQMYRVNLSTGVWTDVSLPFSIQVNCVTHHPAISNWIYAGTDFGIFASEDNGATWSTTPLYGPPGTNLGNDGPAYTEVTDLFWSGISSIVSTFRLWATTFGRGIWRSNWVLDKIYVDRINGNDNNSGTWLAPLRTLKKAATVAGSGATIRFVQGQNNSQGVHEESPSIVLKNRVLFELNNGPVIIQ